MTPLEKCARAICLSAGENPDRIDSYDERPVWMGHVRSARACLDALKEIDPAAKDKATVGGWLEVECGFDEMWNTYIDHILSQ